MKLLAHFAAIYVSGIAVGVSIVLDSTAGVLLAALTAIVFGVLTVRLIVRANHYFAYHLGMHLIQCHGQSADELDPRTLHAPAPTP